MGVYMGFITNFFRDLIQADPGAQEFRQGEAARAAGVARAANPHAGGQARAQWFKGWDHAAEGPHFREGWSARMAGHGQDENPYSPESEEAREWARGWDAFDEWAMQQF